MRDVGVATTLVLLLVVAGCSAPASTEGSVEPASTSVPPSPSAPIAAPSPPALAPGAPSACAFDPCSRVVVEGLHFEPGVAISPTDPDRILVADFGSDGTHEGSRAYLSTSADGGKTWKTVRAPVPTLVPSLPAPEGAPAGQRTIVADTVAAWPAPDTLIAIALLGEDARLPQEDYVRAIHLVQWRSTDGGDTWSDGTIIARAEGLMGGAAGQRLQARWYDKPALALDDATGEIHVVFHRIAAAPNVGFVLEALHIVSRDAGGTWSEPRAVPEFTGLYGASLAAHDGVVLASLRNPGYRVFRSQDAGEAWTEVASFGEERPGSGTWQAAPVALWISSEGILHAALVRSDGAENERLLLHLSQDGGKTWSNATSLLPESATERRNPVLAVDPATGLGFVATYHGDGAAEKLGTWAIPLSRGVPLSPVRLDASPSGTNVFEYFGGAARGGTGVVAYPTLRSTGAPLMSATLRLG